MYYNVMRVLKQQQALVEEHVASVGEHFVHRLVFGTPVDAGGRTRVQRRMCVSAGMERMGIANFLMENRLGCGAFDRRVQTMAVRRK